MRHRTTIIMLHWSTVFLLLAQVKGGSAAPGLRWAFALVAGLWAGQAVLRGLAARPGPKLTGGLRAAYGPLHWALLALVGTAAVLTAGELLGLIPEGPAWTALLLSLAAGALHAVLQLWRHTALRDNALGRIIPRRLHHLL